ncbi:MAG: subtilisin family serine protease [Polaribacter sp.]|jgi:subtilisin family serine protease
MLRHAIILSTTFLILITSISGFAQISSTLQQRINSNSDDFHRVRIEFTENVDCYALNHDFKQNRVTVDQRAKTVINQLQNQAEVSQQEVLSLISTKFSDEVRNLQKFWIVNMLVLEAKSEVIAALAELRQVSLIDIEESTMIPHDEIIRSEGQHQRSPGGIESGLTAINAPAMWALGYTGRGRIVYDYDTGVWPTHPAFADRFLGHRFPMEQCWYGFFSDVPNGNISDHGTHTLGTMAGLVEETQDTIGVAFGAYWIANDFVTSTVAALPPLTDMIGAFEWALNPDGDAATTDDIPDVINNSWRWRDDPDTVQCAGFIVNLMNAIEAAGIANIFSGGNSGPNNSTVNAPQRINTSEINTFSVGSINANAAYPYPISNFSTHGPTQCDYTGSLSLEIHPEVVAPGQNVRSAWGFDEFNTISGTSMAAPHVSGAILLLKEAFPYLSGEDFMWALYLTAIDFGDVGEDNVYGNGLIDVFAAYQYLAQTNTPVDPTVVPWDLAIVSATHPAAGGITCENSFSTIVVVENLGDNTITGINFDYSISGSNSMIDSWSGTLLPGEIATINLSSITTNQFGELGFSIVASIVGQPIEYDLHNNHWQMVFDRREEIQLPLVEDFNNGFDSNGWLIQNDDGARTWTTIETGGLLWTGSSASVQHYSYNPKENQKDGLISQVIVLPNTAQPIWLVFDVAYQRWSSNGSTHDTLAVLASTNCGITFSEELYNKAGNDLNTTEEVQLNFLPELAEDWRRDSISLSSFNGQNLLFKFETTNRSGNNVYIDNVKIFVGNSEPSIIRELDNEVAIYPNPTANVLNLELSDNIKEVNQISVLDVLGQVVKVNSSGTGNRITLYTEELESGLYFLTLDLNQGMVVKRFIKN